MKISKSRTTLFVTSSVVLSFVCFFLVSFLGSISFTYKLIIGSCFYFLLTFFALKIFSFCKPSIILILIVYPLILFNLIINIIDFNKSWVSLPSTSFLLLSSACGYFFYWKKNYFIPICLVLLIIIWFKYGNDIFFNKMLYGSTEQNILFNTPDCILYDTSNKAAPLKSFSKILIIDFWNSHCGPCYRQFPIIDSVNKLIDSNKYKICVVNIPLNGEKMEDNFKILNKYNYSFTKFFSLERAILDSLKIEYYPTTVIIDNSNVIFKGDFKDAIKMITN